MFLIWSPVQEHSSIMSKSLQEMPNSRSWYRGGPKESQLLILVTSTDSLTKSSRMSIETSNCWSILFLPSREIKVFIKTSCCRSSTKLDDECKARRVIPLVYDFLLIRAESRQAGRPAASSPPGDLHQRPLHRWWWPRKPSVPCSRERGRWASLYGPHPWYGDDSGEETGELHTRAYRDATAGEENANWRPWSLRQLSSTRAFSQRLYKSRKRKNPSSEKK